MARNNGRANERLQIRFKNVSFPLIYSVDSAAVNVCANYCVTIATKAVAGSPM